VAAPPTDLSPLRLISVVVFVGIYPGLGLGRLSRFRVNPTGVAAGSP
jgi:hypothetical protein